MHKAPPHCPPPPLGPQAYQQQQLKVTVVEAVGEINNMESMRAVTRIHFRDSQAETFEVRLRTAPTPPLWRGARERPSASA